MDFKDVSRVICQHECGQILLENGVVPPYKLFKELPSS
jgi:hypothetical protein